MYKNISKMNNYFLKRKESSDSIKSYDSVDIALCNELVLEAIFRHLPLKDLKTCRLVSSSWNREAIPFLRRKSCLPFFANDSLEMRANNATTFLEKHEMVKFLKLHHIKVDHEDPISTYNGLTWLFESCGVQFRSIALKIVVRTMDTFRLLLHILCNATRLEKLHLLVEYGDNNPLDSCRYSYISISRIPQYPKITKRVNMDFKGANEIQNFVCKLAEVLSNFDNVEDVMDAISSCEG